MKTKTLEQTEKVIVFSQPTFKAFFQTIMMIDATPKFTREKIHAVNNDLCNISDDFDDVDLNHYHHDNWKIVTFTNKYKRPVWFQPLQFRLIETLNAELCMVYECEVEIKVSYKPESKVLWQGFIPLKTYVDRYILKEAHKNAVYSEN